MNPAPIDLRASSKFLRVVGLHKNINLVTGAKEYLWGILQSLIKKQKAVEESHTQLRERRSATG